MADEGGFEIAKAYVSVDPDAEGFDEKLKAQIGDPEATVTVDADTAPADAAVDDLEGKLDELSARAGDVTVDADTGEASSALDLIEEKLAALQARATELTLSVDDEDAEAKLARIQGYIDEMESEQDSITLHLNDEDAEERLASLDRYIDAFQGQLDKLQESLDQTGQSISDLAGKAEELGGAIDGAAGSMSGMDGAAGGAAESLSSAAEAESRFMEKVIEAEPEIDDQTASLIALASAAGAAGLGMDEYSSSQAGAGASATGLQGTLTGLRDILGDSGIGESVTATRTGLNEFEIAAGDADSTLTDLGNDAGNAASGLGGVGDSASMAHPLIMAMVGGLLGIGPAFIGAASGAAIFAGAAIPAIEDIVHDTGPFKQNLADIKSEYMALADSVKPEVFTDFGDALNQAREILPEFAGAAHAGGVAVGNLITQLGHFGQSGDTQGFLNFVSGATNEDMKAFGNLIQGAATAVYGFAESLNGISTVAINAAGGILSFGGQVLETVPWLGQWALGIGAMYVAAEKIPPMLSAIANSNFAQWITQSEDGLSALVTAYRQAAGGASDAEDAIRDSSGAMQGVAAPAADAAGAMGAFAGKADDAEGAAGDLADSMGAAAGAIGGMDLAGAAGDVEALGGAMADAEGSADVFAGVMGALGAINPLVWVAGAITAVGALGGVLVTTSGYNDDLITSMQKADDASGNNVSGYEKLSKQLTGTAGAAVAVKMATQQAGNAFESAHDGINTYAIAMGKVSAAQKAAAEKAQELQSEVGNVSRELGIAQGPASVVAKDLDIIGDAADKSKAKIAAFDGIIDELTGDANTLWQAQLNIAQGFNTIASDAKTTGASMTGTNQASITLQQAFAQQVSTLDTYAEKQETAGTMTTKTSGYIADQVTKLAGLTGANQTAISQVEGMISQEITWGANTTKVNDAVTKLAGVIDGNMVSSLISMGHNSTTADGEIKTLTRDILTTGSASTQSQGAREALIRDFEKAGLSARQAKADVAKLIAEIDAIPTTKNVDIHIIQTGQLTSGNYASLHGATGGYVSAYAGGGPAQGYVRGPGSHTSDSIPARLSDGEYVVKASSVQKYGRPMLDDINSQRFADGGSVGASNAGGKYEVTINLAGNASQLSPEQGAAVKRLIAQAIAAA